MSRTTACCGSGRAAYSGGSGALMSRDRNWLYPRECVYVTLALVPLRSSRSTPMLDCSSDGMTMPGAKTTMPGAAAACAVALENGDGYPGSVIVYRTRWAPSYFRMS
jgi:hypothetical protein